MFKKKACREKQAIQDKQTEKGTIPMLILQEGEERSNKFYFAFEEEISS